MPSSISSSENNVAAPGRFAVPLKVVVAGVLVFGAVVLSYRQMVTAFERLGDGFMAGGMVSMLEYLPELTRTAEGHASMMLFGTSMVEAGFTPNEFDRTLAARGLDTLSFNYGVANLNPEFQAYITRRIREHFERENFQLSLALIEFNPFQATVTRKEGSVYTAEQNVAVLASNRELWQKTLEDPASGVRMFGIKHLREGWSAELFSSLPLLLGPRASPDTEEFRAAQAAVEAAGAGFGAAFAQDNFPPSPLLGWHPLTRGGALDKAMLSPATLAALDVAQQANLAPALRQVDLQNRIGNSDILELRFDESLVSAFIRMVLDMKAVSVHTEVILLPRNTAWVSYTPEVQARLDAMKRRIEQETGVRVRDFQALPAIGDEHFRDVTHLNLDGAEIFSQFLAGEYAEFLAE